MAACEHRQSDDFRPDAAVVGGDQCLPERGNDLRDLARLPVAQMTGEPDNITLELRIQLNGQRWTVVADEIIAAAERLGVTVVGSNLSRCLDTSASPEQRQGDA